MPDRQLDASRRWFTATRLRSTVANMRRSGSRLADFFASERRFLERVARPGMAVLDVGCACGGLLNALRELVGDVDYVGVDMTPALLEEARLRHPQATFLLADASEGLADAAMPFDLVTAIGCCG